MSKEAHISIGKAFLLSVVLVAVPALVLRWLVM